MTQKKSRTQIASAVSLALASMMLSAGVNAGKIDNTNNTGTLGLCSVLGQPTVHGACIGAWNLDNVDVQLVKADDITAVIGSFDELSGAYTTMTYGDSFRSYVTDGAATPTVMARVSGKDWPVGEPTGIKAVIDDAKVKEGKPQNCIINTSYLGYDGSSTGVNQYLDSTKPEPVICSSGFQTHKRFKIAMLPSTVEGVAPGGKGKGIDLVFNVANDGTTRDYQVFSKINNYTGVQLKGYEIVVGTGVGANFQSADELNIESQLFLSLGEGEILVDADNNPATPSIVGNIFDGDGLATFSHGLFGAPDKHFLVNGFFDERTAGFNAAQKCSVTTTCTPYTHPVTGVTLQYSDTIYSTTVLPSNYTGPATPPLTAPLFGDWLPAEWAPKGIFFDFDNDPGTDADLVAWWNGTAWVKNYDSGFAPVSAAEFAAWGNNQQYSIDVIEDVLNLGLNYIIKVGDGIPGGKITIRIIPVVADAQVKPGFVDTTPTSLVPSVVPTSSGGGGCAVGGNGRFDPTLPALLAMGLGFFGWRRFKAGK